jgi:hypothetical protein
MPVNREVVEGAPVDYFHYADFRGQTSSTFQDQNKSFATLAVLFVVIES